MALTGFSYYIKMIRLCMISLLIDKKGAGDFLNPFSIKHELESLGAKQSEFRIRPFFDNESCLQKRVMPIVSFGVDES